MLSTSSKLGPSSTPPPPSSSLLSPPPLQRSSTPPELAAARSIRSRRARALARSETARASPGRPSARRALWQWWQGDYLKKTFLSFTIINTAFKLATKIIIIIQNHQYNRYKFQSLFMICSSGQQRTTQCLQVKSKTKQEHSSKHLR